MKERFDVKGMTCAACQAHVEKATKSVNGVIECNVNLLNNNMDVTYDETICKKEDIFKAVKNAGYEVITKEKKNDVKNDNHSLRNLIISFILLIILMYFSMGHMMWGFWAPSFLDMHENPVGFALIQFLLVLPICFIYRRYFISGFKMLFKGNPNMDSLIALGASASIIYGIVALFIISYGVSTNNHELVMTYHDNLYYESAGMILTLVSLGKYFEELSKRKTTKELDNLISLAPKKGKILVDGNELEIDVKDIKVDDILIIRTGDQVPVDGVVIEGNCSIDEANITGESIPKYKDINDFCYSSTTLTSGFIKMKATKVGDDTSINTIIHLVEEASNSKAPISKLADKISKYFVPIIILISLLTFAVNMIVSRDFELSLRFAITVLVIACPCALGLATPVAIMVGTGKGASLGLIIKNAEILENSGKIKTIIFDKTGTLTMGKPIVTDYDIDPNLKDIIYSIEYKSSHPLAKSICEYLNGTILIDDVKVENIDGRGLKATYKNDLYYIGNDKLFDDLKINNPIKDKIIELSNEGKTTLVFIKNNEYCGYISLKDLPKENSKELINELNNLNINTVMLTGDNKLCAESIAKDLNIKEVISDVLPIDKGNVINDYKNKNDGLVAMVGDGVNDAIALANSDIAISVQNGSDIARDTSDIVLIHNDIFDIYNVVKLSRRTINTIKICLFWAFFYNAICVILATGIFYYLNNDFKINPMIGSIAMSISSVSVVLTALTINLFKPYNKNIVIKEDKMEVVINVNGMMCEHCVKHVEEACLKANNVKSAKANLKKKNVVIEYDNEINLDEVKANIINAGYEVK